MGLSIGVSATGVSTTVRGTGRLGGLLLRMGNLVSSLWLLPRIGVGLRIGLFKACQADVDAHFYDGWYFAFEAGGFVASFIYVYGAFFFCWVIWLA